MRWLLAIEGGDRTRWVLYFDVSETSARRAQDALHNHEEAEEIDWRAKLAGGAIVQDDKLAIVPGTTRVEVQDVPEPDPSAQGKWRRSRRRR